MSKQFTTTDERCKRALACCGHAPNRLAMLDSGERAQLAALCGMDGSLAAGAHEKCRLLLVNSIERRKATDAELDEPTELEK